MRKVFDLATVALPAALVALSVALTACETTGGGEMQTSVAAMPAQPDNTTNLGELIAGGAFKLKPGESRWIYAARGRRCTDPAPKFSDVMANLKQRGFTFSPEIGELYDAGVGYRTSDTCPGNVDVRAIGIKLNPNFTGQADLWFWTDKVTLIVEK